MTKHIRIENADTSDYKVRVYVETQLEDGSWHRDPMPTELDYPTAMTSELIWKGKRLVIEELAS
jgi:hypothetical protein